MIKAIVITPTELPKVVEVDQKNSYNQIKQIIGGWLEAIPIGHDAIAYIDEEGKIKADCQPINAIATAIANIPGDYIRGPMVIFGRADDEGNETDVPERLVNLIMNQRWEVI